MKHRNDEATPDNRENQKGLKKQWVAPRLYELSSARETKGGKTGGAAEIGTSTGPTGGS